MDWHTTGGAPVRIRVRSDYHFLRDCKAITAFRVMTLDYFETRTLAVKSPCFLWRGITRTLESRWRERSKKFRAVASVPQHPADEQDEAGAKEDDTLALREITADDIRFHFTAAQTGTRVQHSDAEKPRKGDARSANQ